MATAAGAGVGHSRAVSLTTVAFVVALPKRQRMGWCWSARRPPPPMRTVEVQPSAVPVGVAAPIQGGDAGGGGAGGGGAGGGARARRELRRPPSRANSALKHQGRCYDSACAGTRGARARGTPRQDAERPSTRALTACRHAILSARPRSQRRASRGPLHRSPSRHASVHFYPTSARPRCSDCAAGAGGRLTPPLATTCVVRWTSGGIS